jgi:signal transduction histidine kinase/ligand-binding sensor domain-containing protein/DNA-binding NarL/FixJ family response regulator
MMGAQRAKYCAVLFISFAIYAHAQNPERIFFEHYSVESGLSHIGVSSIMQDSRGFLWVGTYDGLNRFDGVNFRIFRHVFDDPNSLIHNRISSIIETNDSLLLLGTGKGLCIYDPTSEKFYVPDWSVDRIQNNTVNKLFKDSQNRIWVFVNGSNIYIVDNKRLSDLKIVQQNNAGNTIELYDIVESKDGTFFIASNLGLITINSDLEIASINPILDNLLSIEIQADTLLWTGGVDGISVSSFKKNKNNSVEINVIDHLLPGNRITDIYLDSHSNIWTGSRFNGLYKVNVTDQFDLLISSYTHDPEKLNTLSNDRIGCIYEDRQGIIWIGTSEDGINKYDPSTRGFQKWSRLNSGTYGLRSDNILSIIDYENQILVGTNTGISVMNKRSLDFEKPAINYKPLNDISVSSFYIDSRGILWIGTWRGLYRLLPGKKEIETVERITTVIYDICEDAWGNIWIGNRNGLRKLSLNPDQTISHYKDQMLDLEDIETRLIIRKLYNDPYDSTLWVGTWHNGLIRLIDFNNEDGRITYEQYRSNPENKYGLKSDFVTSVLRVSENSIWVGTEGGGVAHGVFSDDGLHFNTYLESEGLSNNVVKQILIDRNDNLWITTNNGLNKFSIDQRQFTVYNEPDGIPSNYFTNAGLKLADQTILFGGNKGITIFKPDDIILDTIPPIPEFGSFQVSYKKIDPLEIIDGKVLLEKSISKTNYIELAHNQRTFSFELLGLQFTDPLKNHFKYKLQGYDQDWIYPRKGEYFANYANVKPGKYTFEFYAANSNGIWSPEPKSIDIKIYPPLWHTWYAYMLYGLIFIFIFIYSLRLNKRIVTLKHNVELEKFSAEKNKELTEAKVTFFMNVSHEFKTPITLILGPLQLLINHFSNNNIAKSYLKIIKNQANYLNNLLEQLVYFRKAESATLDLKCRYQDINGFIKNLIDTYQWQAVEQRIELRYIHPGGKIFLWFDSKKMEKVLHNLISNALKYTDSGGHVKLMLNYDESDNIIIRIKDNGKGISSDHINHIFERFYQVDDSTGGYGIGLSLTKSLIDLHKGQISVVSTEGKGTEFTITLKSGTDHLNEKQMIDDAISLVPDSDNSRSDHADNQTERVKPSDDTSLLEKKEVILVVEDNLRMLSFIETFLSPDFIVMTAKNGREALELIDMNLPDLIISDVMMPEMDGIALLKKIKEDLITCHIPVILLSAKSEVQYQIEGLEHGADHYVPKPFDVNLLIAKVNGIIQNRNKIKERIKNNLPFDLSKENFHPMDVKLLGNIKQIVAENYNNPDFDSNLFSKKTYINRSQFFKKMKALTNQTPTEYIREYRMSKAVEFMVKEKIPVSEVHYKVGISSRSYFTKCFKEFYGKSPSEFLKKKDISTF